GWPSPHGAATTHASSITSTPLARSRTRSRSSRADLCRWGTHKRVRAGEEREEPTGRGRDDDGGGEAADGEAASIPGEPVRGDGDDAEARRLAALNRRVGGRGRRGAVVQHDARAGEGAAPAKRPARRAPRPRPGGRVSLARSRRP